MEAWKIKKLIVIFGALLALLYLVFEYNQYTKYLGMVPKEIDVSYFFTYSTKDFGACGAAIFTLRDETYNSILKDGLSFLNGVNKTRRFYKNRGVNKPLVQGTYDAWIKTSKSERSYWSSDAAFSGLYCYDAENASIEIEEIRRNIKEFGAYYTRIKYVDGIRENIDGSRLLIVPSMKVAIIEYWGY